MRAGMFVPLSHPRLGIGINARSLTMRIHTLACDDTRAISSPLFMISPLTRPLTELVSHVDELSSRSSRPKCFRFGLCFPYTIPFNFSFTNKTGLAIIYVRLFNY